MVAEVGPRKRTDTRAESRLSAARDRLSMGSSSDLADSSLLRALRAIDWRPSPSLSYRASLPLVCSLSREAR